MPNRQEDAGTIALTEAPHNERATVLIVDDDPSTLTMLRMLFEQQGYRVLKATSGREAMLIQSAQDRVDLIVTDIDMPGMDGMELARWFDGDGKDAPVIIVSGLDVDPDEVCASAESVVGFFAKPVDIQALLETARAAVAS